MWTQADRDDALAWLTWERRRCTSCGFHPADDPNAYRATQQQCAGCAKLETTRKVREQRSKGKGDDVALPGAHWALTPIPHDHDAEDDGDAPGER